MGIYAYFGQATIPATAVLVPFLMLLQTIFVAGIVMCVSSASVLLRDLRDIIANLMQLGFFITPIIYWIDKINSHLIRALLRLNPMTPFVVSYQDVLFFGRLPALSDALLMVVYAFVSMMLGITVFDRLREFLSIDRHGIVACHDTARNERYRHDCMTPGLPRFVGGALTLLVEQLETTARELLQQAGGLTIDALRRQAVAELVRVPPQVSRLP